MCGNWVPRPCLQCGRPGLGGRDHSMVGPGGGHALPPYHPYGCPMPQWSVSTREKGVECKSPARSHHPSQHKGEGWSPPVAADGSGLRAIGSVHGVVVGQIVTTVVVPPKHCHPCHSTESMPLLVGECH